MDRWDIVWMVAVFCLLNLTYDIWRIAEAITK